MYAMYHSHARESLSELKGEIFNVRNTANQVEKSWDLNASLKN
jgi:hypothetical protein